MGEDDAQGQRGASGTYRCVTTPLSSCACSSRPQAYRLGDSLTTPVRNTATGMVLTTAALILATNSMRKGNRAQFNRMLRFRVAAQGFTVVGAWPCCERSVARTCVRMTSYVSRLRLSVSRLFSSIGPFAHRIQPRSEAVYITARHVYDRKRQKLHLRRRANAMKTLQGP